LAAVLVVVAASTGAMAQSPYYDDLACRQYADAQIAPLRDQANAQTSAARCLAPGLGCHRRRDRRRAVALGIGAASGAIVGTGAGAPTPRTRRGYLQQQYNAYYAQCMSARSAPSYGAPAPAYSPGPRLCAAAELCASDGPVGRQAPPANLTDQELNRLQAARQSGTTSVLSAARY